MREKTPQTPDPRVGENPTWPLTNFAEDNDGQRIEQQNPVHLDAVFDTLVQVVSTAEQNR